MRKFWNIEYQISNIAIAFFALVFVFLPYSIFSIPNSGVAHAATLSLDPATGSFGPGDMFVITVRMTTDIDECVNAAKIELRYPTDWMKATAVSKGESLLTLFTDEPAIDIKHGTVSFAGGIPAGYCGRVQGDPGKTNILAKVVFTIPGNMIGGKVATGPVPMEVVFGSSTKVLLNDGFGTEAPLTLMGASLTHILASSGIKNEWLDIVRSDNVPPDEFKVSIDRSPSTFDGRYFIIFTAIDKQSGVHHFEVREDDPGRMEYVRGKNERAVFVTASSPYALNDQELKSRVTVRAIDNAGNIRESILPPSSGTFSVESRVRPETSVGEKALWSIFSALILVFAGGFGSWHYTRLKRRKQTEESAKKDRGDVSM